MSHVNGNTSFGSLILSVVFCYLAIQLSLKRMTVNSMLMIPFDISCKISTFLSKCNNKKQKKYHFAKKGQRDKGTIGGFESHHERKAKNYILIYIL